MTDRTSLCGPPLGLDELRERQLRILDAIADYCAREGLRLYLCAGTLLGAVRHQGYIPWDDDLDVMLPRADYERFCRGFDSGKESGLSVRSLQTSPTYPLPFAKVCDDATTLDVQSDVIRDIGVNVDVFPVDGWCDGVAARRLQRAAIAVLGQAMRAKHLPLRVPRGRARNTVLATAKALLAWLPPRRISEALTWVARRGSLESPHAGVVVWGYHEVIPRQCYGVASTVRFEGRQYPAPAEPDTVLRILYGDYLQLPPEAKRISRHRFVAYLREPEARIPVRLRD